MIGQLLIRHWLVERTHARWSELRFARTQRGRPYVLGYPDVDFNISHDGQRIVLVGLLGPGRVGIDVMRDELPHWALGDVLELQVTLLDHLTPAERAALPDAAVDGGAALRRHLLRLWCLKEAVAKAIGDGLASDLRRFDFDLAEQPARASVNGAVGPFYITEPSLSGYVVALACDRSSARLRPRLC